MKNNFDDAAFASACTKLGLTAALLPARLEDGRSYDSIADLADSLHAERKALLAAEDVLTAAEREVLQPLLATFKANYVPMSDALSTVEAALKWVRIGGPIRHLPGVERPDAFRQRLRSWALRPGGCRFSEIHDAAAANAAAFRPNVLDRLFTLKLWASRLRTHATELRVAAQETASRRGAI